MNFETPEPNEQKKEHDLDLGDGHWIDWTSYHGQRCGGIITHTTTKNEAGLCSGSFWTDSRYHIDCGKQGPVWKMAGTDEKPTFTPSFLCACGDHGFVRDGKWIRA